jgi:hypothetical protein
MEVVLGKQFFAGFYNNIKRLWYNRLFTVSSNLITENNG